jgi:hypothetical protein
MTAQSMSEGKKEVAFLKKSSAKNFYFPRLLSGHSRAAQKPWEIKVFCIFFLKKKCLLPFPNRKPPRHKRKTARNADGPA